MKNVYGPLIAVEMEYAFAVIAQHAQTGNCVT